VFLKQFVQRGYCVVDIGANIGTHAVPLAMAVGPTGTVIAFEPQRIPFHLLCANAVLNNLRNVKAINAGVSDVSTILPVPVSADGNVGATQIEGWDHGEAVQVLPLDAIPLPPVHLIKIDVEGMEKKVLDGARNTIARYRPLLFVENNIPENSEALIARLIELGYDCWWHLEPYYNQQNLYGNKVNIFPGVGRPEINLFCAPKERRLTVAALAKVTGPDDDWRRISTHQT
jgi:FkbM family methyltransferase